MDPITHAVIGASIAKLTGQSISMNDPAMIGMVLGSVLPDMDILLQRWGDYVYLKNHRGATHSILGLTVSAILIAMIVGSLYGSSFPAIFLWTMAGSLSHVLFDMFNCYGAKLLWPFVDKKYSLNLLMSFDPALVGLLTTYLFSSGQMQSTVLSVFAAYLFLKILIKLNVRHKLQDFYHGIYTGIRLFPSMTGLLKWNFIMEAEDYTLIGEKSFLKGSMRIVKRMDKLQEEEQEKVLYSSVGKFFSEFTPSFHIGYEKVGEVNRYIFTDMRYYIRNNFLHHAVVEMDENDCVVKSSFNPYTMSRSTSI